MKKKSAYGQEEEKKKFSLAEFKKSLDIYRFIRPYKVTFSIGLIFLLFSSLTSLAFPFFAGKLLDVATGRASALFPDINTIAFWLGGVLVFQSFFSYFRIYLFSIVTERISADMRFALYRKMMNLPVNYFDRHRTGELNSRITTDVAQLHDMLSTTLAEFFRQVATLIVGVAIILFLSPKLTFFMIATFPLLVILAFVFGKHIRKLSKSRQDELATANVVVDETLQAIKVVKAFTNEFFEVMRYKKALHCAMDTALKAARYRAAFVSFIIFALFGGIVLVLWFGARLVATGELSVGELTSFIIYTSFIGAAVGGLGDLYSQVQRTIGSSERILEILAENEEEAIIADPQKPENIKRVNGEIIFEDVTFSYPSRQDINVLNKINFRIAPGAKVALVGPSGAGKSTVAQLMLRFYEPQSGDIFIDNKPIQNFSVEELRGNVGIVPQETILFGGSIRENILYGKPGATETEIIDAAKKANAWSFINSFPDKLDTIVGERGVQLSGGQRQRLAIARAILKDPAILILDEATSSLDSESERLVQEALDELMQNRTSLIIAHRLSTVKKADIIFVINNGRIMESGTHDELLHSEYGLYSHLVKMQLA